MNKKRVKNGYYKFYCFDGRVKLIMINSDRMSNKNTKADYFDENYQHLDFKWGYDNADSIPKKPEKFELMKALAEKLSTNIPHGICKIKEMSRKLYNK